jgi:hypothetical protein
MAQSWLKQETSSSHPERAGGRAAQAQVQAHEQPQVHSNVPSANMSRAAIAPSSVLRSQAAAAGTATTTVQVQARARAQAQAQAYTQAQLPTSASMTPVFPITDLTTTHPPSFHPTAATNNFNPIDIPYAESTYSSSNVSAASTSTPATPVTGVGAAEGSVVTRSPSISATASSAEAPTASAPASSDLTASAAAPKVKAKRVRTSKPKVKTGCTNCKFVSPILVPSPLLA